MTDGVGTTYTELDGVPQMLSAPVRRSVNTELTDRSLKTVGSAV